jgi:hypothetical protein
MYTAQNFVTEIDIFSTFLSPNILRIYASIIINKTGNVHINVTLGRARETVVAVEKQLVLHILSVCL